MRLAALLAVAVAALLAAPAASFGAVTIGNNLSGGGNLTNTPFCGACTFVQVTPLTASHTAAGGLTAPSDGVITHWRIKAGSEGAVFLRVLRKTGDATFTGVARSEERTTDTNAVAEFPASVPIKAGDHIGVDNS